MISGGSDERGFAMLVEPFPQAEGFALFGRSRE